MDDQVWDVIVIGAGPAGSTAANASASKGASTLLVDAAAFPRYKTCGGGLIGISASLVNDMPGLPLRDVINTVSFTLRGQHQIIRRSDKTVMEMVSREEFDEFLVRRAEKAGATFRPNCKVRSIEEKGDLVLVHVGSDVLRARAVVGADGSSSKIARYVGVEYALSDLGLECELAAGDQASKWKGRVHLDWGSLPGSYGWVFPKGDVLTVGVISRVGDPEATKSYYESFMRSVGVADLHRLRDSGHLTRCRKSHSPLSRGRVLVAGDAAGFLEPWTREGISYAIRSGTLAGSRAAQAAQARTDDQALDALRAYGDDLQSSLIAEMDAGFQCREAFESAPQVFHFMIGRTKPGWRYFVRICNGDTNFARAMAHLSTRLVVGSLKSVGRARRTSR